MNNIITTKQDLPSTPMPLADQTTQLLRSRRRIDEWTKEIMCMVKTKDKGNYAEKLAILQDAFAEYKRFFEQEIPVILNRIEQAKKKANSADIFLAVALLLLSFPNVRENFDSTIYSQLIIRHLEESEVDEGTVGLGFRHILLNYKWLPSIAQINEAMIEGRKALLDIEEHILGSAERPISRLDTIISWNYEFKQLEREETNRLEMLAWKKATID
jgi:hypothetical protein